MKHEAITIGEAARRVMLALILKQTNPAERAAFVAIAVRDGHLTIEQGREMLAETENA